MNLKIRTAICSVIVFVSVTTLANAFFGLQCISNEEGLVYDYGNPCKFQKQLNFSLVYFYEDSIDHSILNSLNQVANTIMEFSNINDNKVSIFTIDVTGTNLSSGFREIKEVPQLLVIRNRQQFKYQGSFDPDIMSSWLYYRIKKELIEIQSADQIFDFQTKYLGPDESLTLYIGESEQDMNSFISFAIDTRNRDLQSLFGYVSNKTIAAIIKERYDGNSNSNIFVLRNNENFMPKVFLNIDSFSTLELSKKILPYIKPHLSELSKVNDQMILRQGSITKVFLQTNRTIFHQSKNFQYFENIAKRHYGKFIFMYYDGSERSLFSSQIISQDIQSDAITIVIGTDFHTFQLDSSKEISESLLESFILDYETFEDKSTARLIKKRYIEQLQSMDLGDNVIQDEIDFFVQNSYNLNRSRCLQCSISTMMLYVLAVVIAFSLVNEINRKKVHKQKNE